MHHPTHYLNSLKIEARALRATIDNLNNQKVVYEETIRELTVNLSNRIAQIDTLTSNASSSDEIVDGLRDTMAIREDALRQLQEHLATDRLLLEATTLQLTAANEAIVALQATVDRLQECVERYAETISQLSQQVQEQGAEIDRLRYEARAREVVVVAEAGIEYCHEFGVDPDAIEVNHDLLEDIHRTAAYLAPQVSISRRVVGSVLWVMATWQPLPSPSANIDDNDAPPKMTLRIEVDPIGYTTALLQPTFKITHEVDGIDDEEFPVGKRVAQMMAGYMGRCWGRGSGFKAPATVVATSDALPGSGDIVSYDAQSVSAEFEYDTDPRCVVPYVADEGRLVAHLVRYAMLRMETYADFCVVCDRPIVDSRDVVCGSELCDHSFHGLGVGYDAVGLERTMDTAPELRVRPATKLLSTAQPAGPERVEARARSDGSSSHLSAEPLTVLMITYVLRSVSGAFRHARLCSAGSKGYCAIKEMLQNGVVGQTHLIESGDLRGVDSSSSNLEEQCCLIYFRSGRDEDYSHIPNTVQHVAMFTNSVTMPNRLLYQCTSLTTLDLTPLSQVTSIKPGFLQGCTGLTELDLSPFSQVTEIHEDFLRGCSGLTTLDLSPLSRVTSMEGAFVLGCEGLTEVLGVHEGFLRGCSGLKTIDFSPFSQIVAVGGRFLEGCSGLTSLDLSPLSQLTHVSRDFLKGCTILDKLDLEPLSQVTEIRRGFLGDCTGLKALDMSPLLLVSTIQNDFLTGCTHINKISNPPLLCSPPLGWSELVKADHWVRDDGTCKRRQCILM